MPPNRQTTNNKLEVEQTTKEERYDDDCEEIKEKIKETTMRPEKGGDVREK